MGGPTGLPELAGVRVHSASIVDYDNDDDEEFILSEDDGINLKLVKQRQAKHSMRKARNRGKQPPSNAPAPKRERFSPMPEDEQPAPPPLPPAVPRSTEEWPADVRAVRPTDVRLADSWFDFVPIRHRQGQILLREAREQMAGAYHRVRHLIQQIDDYPGYMGIRGMALVKQNWSMPRPQGSVPTPAPPAQNPSLEDGAARASMRQPTHRDPPEVWHRFYQLHPRSIPPGLRIDPTDPLAVPSLHLIRANLMFRRFVPTVRKGQASPRAAMLESIARVFSVHGLYDRIRTMGNYPVGPIENIQPFPPEF